jgi:zinc protease
MAAFVASCWTAAHAAAAPAAAPSGHEAEAQEVAMASPTPGGAPERGTAATAVLLPVPDDPTVSFTLWFQVGSQDDPPGKEGLAYLVGELLQQGSTKQNRYEDILKKLYPLASSYDARVDKEMTTLRGRTHRDTVDRFFGLYTQAFLEPAFLPEDFERLRSDQLNYLRNTLRYASDEELAKAALHGFVFAATAYQNPPQGTVAGLESITLDDVKAFYAKHYTRDSAVVALGGGYAPALQERFEAAVRQLPAGRTRRLPAPTPAPAAGRQVLLVAKPGADASISFGFPVGVRRGERDFYALWVANSWLGEHRNSSSHLYQVIREARGLNYGDYSYIEAFPEAGQRRQPPPNVGRRQQLFEVWIRTLKNDWAHFALRAAMRELERLVDRGMTPEEFALTRDFLTKYSLHYAETTAARLGYAVDDRFYGLDASHLARFRAMMRELTVEDVNAAIRRHLQSENLRIAIVTGEAEKLRDALVADLPSPMSYEAEKPAAVLAEDREIAGYPLRIRAADVRIVPVEQMFEK